MNEKTMEDKIKDEIYQIARCRYNCSRVWEAWQVGTMTESDFSPLEEDEEFIEEIYSVVTQALKSQQETLQSGVWESLPRSVKARIKMEIENRQQERLVGEIEKMKKEHSKMMCKFPNCGDPVCGHERCIDWMYGDLIEHIKKTYGQTTNNNRI